MIQTTVHLNDIYMYPTLTFRWVEAREDNTNAQGDGKSWFRTYRPVLDEGWFWLGQSLDDRWALQVRENGSYGEALGPVRDTTLIHKNAGSEAKGGFMLSLARLIERVDLMVCRLRIVLDSSRGRHRRLCVSRRSLPIRKNGRGG